MDYTDFLKKKEIKAPRVGINVMPGDVNAMLFPFQRDITRWSLRRGRAAIFSGCGTGKTAMQVTWAERIARHTGMPVLILAPLAVSHQSVGEGAKFGVSINPCRSQSDVRNGVNITNYQMMDHFDPHTFGGVVIDESGILKSFDGKTRNQIIDAFEETPYRLACTATPAPNDFMEIGNHSEFLGIMSRTEMLATFFVHDGGDTSKWALKGHAESKFWEWVASWAVMIERPSDIGYSDEGYILPPLYMHHDVVDRDIESAFDDGRLFPVDALTLEDRRAERRATIGDRVAKCAEVVTGREGAWLIWCNLNAEGDAIEAAIPGAVQVSGSDTDAFKEQAVNDFTAGRIRVLISKPSMFGYGLNFQHCANVAFVGLSDSFEQYYQAIRRCWRFGQTQPVHCHIITANTEGAVVANIERKEKDAKRMTDQMIAHMKDINAAEVHGAGRDVMDYRQDVERSRNWELRLGDCIDGVSQMADDSVGYTIFSPPFASLYTYTNSDRDMGNSRDYSEFAEHFQFLVPELLRVTIPGRLLSFHCMNLPLSKERDGVIGLRDFRGELIRLFMEHGWVYHSEVVIWKDPVTSMQRTKALGLLHKQVVKDSAMSRQGIPDYLVTMRKPGVNPVPVSGLLTDYAGEDAIAEKTYIAKLPPEVRRSIDIWQRYASPVWFDINPQRTLNYIAAREKEDGRHICPLQLDVIERAMQLWSIPGDLVYSPFTGVGSEGYTAIKMGRRFVGDELKPSYWELACKNLRDAEKVSNAPDLFTLDAPAFEEAI